MREFGKWIKIMRRKPNKANWLLVLGVGGLALLLPFDTAKAASATGNASAIIQNPLRITSTSQLLFGSIKSDLVEGEEQGTITITPQNERTTTGNLKASGVFSRAEFLITGAANTAFEVDVQNVLAQHDKSTKPEAGVTSLQVTELNTLSRTTGVESNSGYLGPDGTDTIFVGGTLRVPVTAKNGRYRGEVTIIVSF